MESDAKYTLVGGFVIGAFVLIILGVLWLSNSSVTKDVKFFKIYFRNQTLNGLQLSSPVNMKGIKIGIVDKLGISKKSIELVQVTVKLDKSAPIKIGTKATITRNMLTGLAVVELSGAKQDSPDLTALEEDEPYPIIPEGKSDYDSVAASVPELLKDATEVLGQLKEVLSPENLESLHGTLKNTEKLSGSLAAKGDDIGTLITSSAKVIKDLERITGNVERFTRPGDGDFAKLNQSLVESAEEVKRQIQAVGERASKAASEFSNSFRVIAQDVNTASTSVAQASRSFASTAEHLGDLRSIVRGPDEKNLGPGERRRTAE
jgi:phospholipid/cholesterol/gamma-HCH transport system substrate-binding protein